jgi:hypothetical protein
VFNKTPRNHGQVHTFQDSNEQLIRKTQYFLYQLTFSETNIY